MTPNFWADSVWLERKVAGVINFRLPGDPMDIPRDVMHKRREEYYREHLGEEKYNARVARRNNLGNSGGGSRRGNSTRSRTSTPVSPVHTNSRPSENPADNGRGSGSKSGSQPTRETPDIRRKASPQADLIDEYEAMASNPYFGLSQE